RTEDSKDIKEEQAKKHTVPANTITIREDLADDFRQNRIMIDVEVRSWLDPPDEDYRKILTNYTFFALKVESCQRQTLPYCSLRTLMPGLFSISNFIVPAVSFERRRTGV
ncbi:hypothetical protein H0H92_015665, partial [Tricholoma furcatifolium]